MLHIAFDPQRYAHPLPEDHRFPMEKYRLIPEQLVYEGTISEENLFCPSPAPEADLLRAHTADYWHKLRHGQLLPAEVRRTGFPWSAALVDREIAIAQGTISNALFALKYGISMNVAGGTHHAYSNRGEGFCLLNDQAIAALYLLHHNLTKKILIIDLDVHQGNGTAEIFTDISEVFTFSMHGDKNYPLHKEKSDLDIPLPTGTDNAHYLSILREILPRLLDQHQPDFVFYLAGVDVLETDKLGTLSLTREGCRQRDKLVLETCHRQRIPVAVSLGGGYSPNLRDIVEAHCNTFRLAQEIWF